MKKLVVIIFASALSFSLAASSHRHPCLLLSKDAVVQMKAVRGSVPLFDASLAEVIDNAERALEREINLPRPEHGGGGYSHETHKLNYFDMYNCGIAWQITGKRAYADRVKAMLTAYAELYPTLGYHPLNLSPVPGRIFWQTLNESVWLLHAAQAYDCIYDTLSSRERRHLESVLFRPYAEFIMNGTADNRANQRTFNNLNNHATWANAAVGMIAIVMGDDAMLRKALYGKDESGEVGFMRQLDVLFSPDGYFTEGAYYQRYAIWPFMIFAQCLQHNRPDLGIFTYRDGILLKAVDTLLQMAYDGQFMHFNDALEKGYDAQELVSAVDIAYLADPSNKELLSVAADYQQKVLVSDAGFAVAKAIAEGQARPLKLRSCILHDGADGSEGAFVIMRSPREGENSALTFKATSHGLSHGHFDRLNFAYYDAGNEIVTDYGAARFLNIVAKYNGHYTHENNSYAKQTIAHNTLVVDAKSQFQAKMKDASDSHPEITACSLGGDVQMVASREENAYPGVSMERWLFFADVPFLQFPLVMDLLRATSSESHCYDYPVHYLGHMIELSVPYSKALETMHRMGDASGYQHLWVEAEADAADGTTAYTWLTGYRMYSISTATAAGDKVFIARTGASDPDFNLRSEPAYILRHQAGPGSTLFASCLETHGKYDIKVEQSANLDRSCTAVEVTENSPSHISVRYSFKDGRAVLLDVDLSSDQIKYNVSYE
ncbi:MAG: heparinase II/III family protein [Bacteroidales bacterium]|nr:heparinase II/III family protein [Bacteroidales bacterium]